MVKLNIVFVFSVCLSLSIVFKEVSSRIRCPPLQVENGRVRERQSGRARITCNSRFKLVRGNPTMNCIGGKWYGETPICARPGCPIVDKITHGKLNVFYEGAKLEVVCNLGYTVNGSNFVYCDEFMEWNEQVGECIEHDHFYTSCDFESSEDRLCGWKNDILNDVNWLADRSSTFSLLTRRLHVPPGSSQYFSMNYISLDAENYGTAKTGRLVSPAILPAKTLQRCLIFSYKVTAGISHQTPFLKVLFGNIPHWATSEGEGRVIIGLFDFDVTSKIVIEGHSCRAAIDNLIVVDGESCAQLPYEEEVDSCHDNCGKISKGTGCSCDWKCHTNNNCCSDIEERCPYIKPLEEIAILFLQTTTTASQKTVTVKNSILNTTSSNFISFSRIANDFKVSNDSIIETTPMNERNITINNITRSSVIIQSNFPPRNETTTLSTIPQTTQTILPTTITQTTPSTTLSTKATKLNNSTSFLRSTFPSLVSKDFISDSNIVANISTTTPRQIYKSSAVNSILTSKNVSISTMITPYSTIKPSIMNMTTIKFDDITKNTTNFSSNNFNFTTPSLTNTSGTYVKSLRINIVSSATESVKSSYSTYKTILTFSPNVSTNIEELNTTYVTKSPYVQKSIQNITSKPTINNVATRAPRIIEHFKSTTVSNKNIVIYDVLHKNPNLLTSKYDVSSKDKQLDTLLNNNNISVENTNSTNHSGTKPNAFWQNAKPITDTNLQKPELNHSLHDQLSTVYEDKSSTEHAKPNENAVTSFEQVELHNARTDTATFIKYFAAIGVILITFIFTFSFVRWYFKKRDELNERFIETDDTGSYCNMELLSSNAE